MTTLPSPRMLRLAWSGQYQCGIGPSRDVGNPGGHTVSHLLNRTTWIRLDLIRRQMHLCPARNERSAVSAFRGHGRDYVLPISLGHPQDPGGLALLRGQREAVERKCTFEIERDVGNTVFLYG